MAKEDEGYLLDGSGNRVLSGSGEAVRTGSYDDEKVTQNRMKAAEDKLAEDVQKKLKEDKAKAKAKDDADFDAEEARSKTARAVAGAATKAAPAEAAPTTKATPTKKAPIVTKEELAKSGLSLRDYMNKQQGKTRRGGKAPDAAKPAAKPSELTDKPSAPAAKSSAPAVSNSYRLEGAGKPKPATSAGKSIFQRIAEKETVADKIRRRGEDDLEGRGMKAGGSVKMAKGKSINGIAKRGLTNCKQR